MKNKVENFLKKGILLSPELIDLETIDIKNNTKPLVCDLKILNTKQDVDWVYYDKLKVKFEKTGTKSDELETLFEKQENTKKDNKKVKIIKTYADQNSKKTIKDFITLYNSRFTILQGILRQRQELLSATSIRKINQMQPNETVSIVAMVTNLNLTKNNNILISLEDQTGITKAVVTSRDKDLYNTAKNLTYDEVIGVSGAKGEGIIFVNSIIIPDVPLTKELLKSGEDGAAVFISDVHVGSNFFIEEDFERFIHWIKGDLDDINQKNVKYLFIVGDLVEGIGIFPGQEAELKIKDVYEQYAKFFAYIAKIPKHIEIIICPGNHDCLRVAEPQPTILSEFCLKQDNITYVSSPSIVRIHESETFLGYEILLYHGFSFPYYASNIESIRMNGGLEKTENIMRYLLKKRHLAPSHGSTQFQLGYNKDPLIIESIPDFFVSGHIHRTSVKNYRNVTMLNCSCWISQTDYQEKRGINPQPSRAIYVDLKTRDTKILNFSAK